MDPLNLLLKDNIKLPSPPAIAVRILETVKKDDSSFSELASIISSDPALTARILTIANSSFYSLPSKINTIERALSILGVNTLKNIALSFVITRDLRRESDKGFDFELFWKRSVTGAASANMLGNLIGYRDDDAFVAALLRDLGMVIFSMCRGNDYMEILDEKQISEQPLSVLEQKTFGFNHQELGAEVLARWGLPASIHEPIRHHHQPDSAPEEYRQTAVLLNLADKTASVYHGRHSSKRLNELKEILKGEYGCSEEVIEKTIDAVAEVSVEILSSFEIDSGDMKPFSQILQEANEELRKLNLSYEQLVMEYKQAKERAEKLAYELKDANDKLRDMAFRDGLTGLYNHRYFQDMIDKELSRAIRYKRAFSLLMLDIDHFKKINDTYGHPRGDMVIKKISETIESLIRKADVAARYGGEEFAVILPETGNRGATVLAERIRAAIAGTKIQAEGMTLAATVSIGVTDFVPSVHMVSKADIIAAADRALYRSKNNGRNRVTIGVVCDDK